MPCHVCGDRHGLAERLAKIAMTADQQEQAQSILRTIDEEIDNAGIHVPQDDLYTLLVSSVAYALGRRSYIVGATADMVRSYRRHLTDDQIRVIRRTIHEELDRSERMGATLGMDHDVWQRLLAELGGPP